MTELLLIADDLSGALEVAGTALARTRNVVIARSAQDGSQRSRVLVVDTDSREAPPAEAARAAAAALAPADWVVKKVDSLLRGNIAAELDAMRAAGRHVVFAPALPALQRTVRQGRVHLDGTPLAESSLAGDYWRAATDDARKVVRAPKANLSLEQVRDGSEVVTRSLQDAFAAGAICVCDAETDADLDAIVAAAQDLPEPVRSRVVYAGSGALAAAVIRRIPGESQPGRAPAGSSRRDPDARGTGTLIVSASTAPVISQQLARLGDQVRIERVDPRTLLDPQQRAVAAGAITARWDGHGLLAVVVDPDGERLPERSAELAAALADIVADAAGRARRLVLLGGDTARRTLRRIGVHTLTPLVQAHYGAVISTSPTGQRIAIRPGSYGDVTSLDTIISTLGRCIGPGQRSTDD